jgi:hypothetical protein
MNLRSGRETSLDGFIGDGTVGTALLRPSSTAAGPFGNVTISCVAADAPTRQDLGFGSCRRASEKQAAGRHPGCDVAAAAHGLHEEGLALKERLSGVLAARSTN